MIVLRSTYTASAEKVGALRQAHLDWLQGLIDDGTVITAGRLESGEGAVVVGRGLDAGALVKAFDADPYVEGGVARYEAVVAFPAALGGDAIKALDA